MDMQDKQDGGSWRLRILPILPIHVHPIQLDYLKRDRPLILNH